MQCFKRFSLWKDVIVPLWFESFMCNTEWRGVFKLCQDSSDVMISFLKYKSSSIFSHRAIYNASSQVICSVILLYERMNELCIYIAFYCVLLYTQSALHSCGWGGGGAASTSGWCDGCHRTTAPVRSPHTSYRWRGERVMEPIKWMGIIRRPWLIRASGGNLARTYVEENVVLPRPWCYCTYLN